MPPEAAVSPIQVIITAGPEDPEKVVLGLQTALTAASSGLETSVFFTLRATQWTCATVRDVAGGERIAELIDAVHTCGGEIESCSACLDKYCAQSAQRGHENLRHGVRPGGLASLVRRASRGANTITF